jgi:hypothetical protein
VLVLVRLSLSWSLSTTSLKDTVRETPMLAAVDCYFIDKG